MNIFEIGMEHGREVGIEQGIEQGKALGLEEGKRQSLRMLVKNVELSMKNFHVSLEEACEGLEIPVEEYEKAKRQIAGGEEENSDTSVNVGQEE